MRADVSRSTALHTDRYELTMLDAALRDGTADRRCVFELFGRRLSGRPPLRRRRPAPDACWR